VDVNGRVLAWRYFHDGTANMGDPLDANVVVRESEFEIDRCDNCGCYFGGIGVVIQGGRVEAVRVFQEWPAEIEVFVVGPGGAWVARPEWTDRPMPGLASGGSRVRLFPTAEAQRVVYSA
jgi:hypothetical protein